MTLIAVYGTLRHGHGNWQYFIHQDPISVEEVTGWRMYTLHGGFPGCKHTGNPEDKITIDVYDVDDKTLRAIDGLEGYVEGGNNTFFDRLTVQTSQGEAFIYQFQPDPYNHYPDGDWSKFKKEQRLLHAS